MSHEIIQLKVEDYDNFIYIIADRSTNEAAVVDPAWDGEGILGVLEDERLDLTAILLTHCHHDHINAVNELANKRVSIFLSEKESHYWEQCPDDAILLQDGDEIQLGQSSIGVILTPGHTPGSCCYYTGNHLLTGDTVFIYGCGRADLAHGNVHLLYHSLQRLKKLPPETKIWVGHDYAVQEESTLGEQLAGNPFFMIENEADFSRYRLEIAGKVRKIPYAPLDRETLALQLSQ